MVSFVNLSSATSTPLARNLEHLPAIIIVAENKYTAKRSTCSRAPSIREPEVDTLISSNH
jgi:hypothetical protein